MSSVKESMIEIITRQPDDSSYEEILHALACARTAQRGLSNADNNRTVSDREIKRALEARRK